MKDENNDANAEHEPQFNTQNTNDEVSRHTKKTRILTKFNLARNVQTPNKWLI